jgi:hypothetical protein
MDPTANASSRTESKMVYLLTLSIDFVETSFCGIWQCSGLGRVCIITDVSLGLEFIRIWVTSGIMVNPPEIK